MTKQTKAEELAQDCNNILTGRSLKRYERDQFLKTIIANNDKEQIENEFMRVIKNLERQIEQITEDNDYLRKEVYKDFADYVEAEYQAKIYSVKVPILSYNDCNTIILSKNKKQVLNSQAYEDYKKAIWDQLESKYGDELRSEFPTLKEPEKYVKISCNMYVNNMNKDTDNIEKPFLDTLFNWLNRGNNKNGQKLYSDNQVLVKQSARVRNSGTIMEEEEIYFCVTPIKEKISDSNDMVYRFLRYALDKNNKDVK